jgi:tetratricopeptide (TPR) repeat protein
MLSRGGNAMSYFCGIRRRGQALRKGAIASSLAAMGLWALVLVSLAQAGAGSGRVFMGQVVDRSVLPQFSASEAVPGLEGVTLTLRDASGKTVGSAKTGKQGTFKFRKLDAGSYTLALSRAGYLPNPLVRHVAIGDGDLGGGGPGGGEAQARDFYLDPAQPGKAFRHGDFHAALAEGFLLSARRDGFWRRNVGDTDTDITRYFDAQDTTRAYRSMWLSMLWAEVEGRSESHQVKSRSTVSMVKLAKALDSLLRSENMEIAALAPYRETEVDSVMRYAAILKAIAMGQPLPARPRPAGETLGSGKTGNGTGAGAKPRPGAKAGAKATAKTTAKAGKASKPAKPRLAQVSDLKGLRVPKALALALALEAVRSPALPMAKRKALVAKLRSLYGAEGARALAAALAPVPKLASKSGPAESAPNASALAALVADAVRENPGHAAALFHQGWRKLEAGKAREAVALFERAEASHPGYPALLRQKAKALMALKDTSATRRVYEAMTRSDEPQTQALGHRGLGALAFAAKQLDEAEQAYWRAQGLDAHSREAQEAALVLAEITLARGGDVGGNEAREDLLDSLVKQRPKDPRPHLWLGRLALKRGQEGVAASHFQQAVALAPKEASYAEALAALQAETDEWAAAFKTLAPHRKKLSPDGLAIYIDALLRTGRPADAVEECERLHAQRPDAKSLSRWAQALTAAGQAQKAIGLIRKSPHAGDKVVQVMHALALIEVGQTEEARRLLTPLVAAHPTDAILHLHLGRCFFAAREFAKASDAFGQALRYRQDLSEALHHQGQCMLKLGRAGESHHYFAELADKESRAWKAKGFLGRGEAFAAEGKPEAAEEYLRRSIALVPSPEAMGHLALVMLKANKAVEAEGWAKKARAADKHAALPVLALVDIYLESGRDEEALTLAEAEFESHAQSCEHMLIASKANYRAGLDDRAKEISQKAVQSCPKDPGPRFYLGAVSARSGDKAEAKGHFEAYVEQGGDIQNLPRGYR